MIEFREISLRIAGRLLIDNASATIPTGHKYGLVGRNGAGKTSLFRVLLGESGLESGAVNMPSRARIGTVAQEAPGGETTPLDAVLAADTERSALLEEAETATDPDRIGDIYQRLMDIDAHAAPARAGAILAGLGFDIEAQNRPLQEFSGGWRMRVALASALFARPEILLLDEPTNHLDLEAALWFEDYLKNYNATVIVISHDRDLLNRAVDGILHLHQAKLTTYPGSYDRFERIRAENLSRQAALAQKQESERARLQAFVDRFKAKATKARQAQSRVKRLEKMQPIALTTNDPTISLHFPEPQLLANPLIQLEHLDIGYPGRTILQNLDLVIDQEDRIALLGANGNGKTTLARLLAGELVPLNGKVKKSGKLVAGYFAQDQFDLLDPEKSALAFLAELEPTWQQQKHRALLGKFGFSGDRANTKIGALSGGEKARLVFALMSRLTPQLLILDEPTNHLDIDSRQALIEAINDFPGAVILVSHDRHLLDMTMDRLWLVSNGKVAPFDGDLDDYEKFLLSLSRNPSGKANNNKNKDTTADGKTSGGKRPNMAVLTKKIQELEGKIKVLHESLAKLDKQLADPKLYNPPSPLLADLTKQQSDLTRQLQECENLWLAATEELEAANQAVA